MEAYRRLLFYTTLLHSSLLLSSFFLQFLGSQKNLYSFMWSDKPLVKSSTAYEYLYGHWPLTGTKCMTLVLYSDNVPRLTPCLFLSGLFMLVD